MFAYSKVIKPVCVLIILTGIITSLKAQDQWLTHMPTLHQSYINPAHQLKSKFEVSLPTFGFDINTGGINLNDAIAKNNAGVNVVDLDRIVGNLKNLHPFNGNLLVNTIDVAFRLNTLSIYAGHNVQNQTSFILDRELADILVNGNAGYVGKTVDLNIKGASSTLNQFYIGGSKKIGKIAFGVKLKYVNGWNDVRSEDSNIALTTEEDYYQIKLQNKIRVQSSGIINYSEKIEDITFNTDFSSNGFITANSGFGIDLGLTYAINKELTAMVSALDIGSITWVDRAKTLTNNKSRSINGINLETIIDGGEIENATDSLYGAFDLDQTIGSYSTSLNSQINLGISYVKDGITFSTLYNNQKLIDQNKYSLTFQASKQLSRHIGLGLSYSIKNNNYNNIGVFVNASLGPVNIFAATQNLFSTIDSKKINGVNGRFGLSLSFGRDKAVVPSVEEQ